MNATPPSDHDRARSYEKPAIRPEMTVRQVANDYPACREVFVEYGEPTDRPGKFGHFQPLSRFAQVHGIDLDELLDRISKAAGVPIDRGNEDAEKAHRGFVVAALVITLTLGAGWGAWLLWKIGIHKDFSATSAASIVAHGEAQLWGFIGLFIVGVSLRTVLFDAVRSRAGQWWCSGLFALALASLAAGFAWSLAPVALQTVGLASAMTLLLLAVVYWVVQVRFLVSKWPATWARAVMLSGFWLTVWAAVTSYLRWNAGAEGPGIYSMASRLLMIELAVFGFAMNSIYGFGQMLLPGLLRSGRTRIWAIEAALWLHNLGVAILVAAGTGIVPQFLAVAGLASIAAGTILYAIGQHVFLGKPRASSRPEQGHALLDWYIPLSFVWLVLAMLMLSGASIYELITLNDPPHAFTGAVRHALTVGFMTTLILGVGQRILPVFEHRILTCPSLVAPILLLIGVGNLLRVVFELATIWAPWAYTWMPLSAVLEWTALFLFGVSVGSLMWRRDPLLRTGRVTETSSLAVLLAEHPWIEDRLIADGSSYQRRARNVPRELTIGSFAESDQAIPRDAVELINHLLDRHQSTFASKQHIDAHAEHPDASLHHAH